MKIARLYSFNDIRIEDIPIPDTGPGDALLKTKACGICSGDVMPWYIEKKAPLVIGHEHSGEIVGIGREVNSFKKGEGTGYSLIIMPPALHAGSAEGVIMCSALPGKVQILFQAAFQNIF